MQIVEVQECEDGFGPVLVEPSLCRRGYKGGIAAYTRRSERGVVDIKALIEPVLLVEDHAAYEGGGLVAVGA